MSGGDWKPVTSGWNVLPPENGGELDPLGAKDDPRWQFLSAREALQVALYRGVAKEQARADILRALQEPALRSDGKIIGLGLLFSGAHVGGREWRAHPRVDFENSTLWARATPPGPYETPRRMWVTFKIPRDSVDWLWPTASPAGTALNVAPEGRKRSSRYDEADAQAVEKIVALVESGKALSVHAAAVFYADEIEGASVEAKIKRISGKTHKARPDLRQR